MNSYWSGDCRFESCNRRYLLPFSIGLHDLTWVRHLVLGTRSAAKIWKRFPALVNMVSEPREGVLPCTWKNPPLRHPLLIDKSNFDDLHFFLHHFLTPPRNTFLNKAPANQTWQIGLLVRHSLSIWGRRGGYIRQACSPLIQLFFGFASDIDQTNINRDIRDGNWLSRVYVCWTVSDCQCLKPSGSVVPLVMFKELILPRKKFL